MTPTEQALSKIQPHPKRDNEACKAIRGLAKQMVENCEEGQACVAVVLALKDAHTAAEGVVLRAKPKPPAPPKPAPKAADKPEGGKKGK